MVPKEKKRKESRRVFATRNHNCGNRKARNKAHRSNHCVRILFGLCYSRCCILSHLQSWFRNGMTDRFYSFKKTTDGGFHALAQLDNDCKKKHRGEKRNGLIQNLPPSPVPPFPPPKNPNPNPNPKTVTSQLTIQPPSGKIY